MSYETYRYIFIGALIACGVFFVIAVILFFAFKIPKVISDLSGRTARKAIENIRLHNEQTGDKTYQSSAVNMERGKLTDKISKSGRIQHREATPFGTGVITEKISTMKLDQPAGETDVLMVTEETSVLSSPAGETEVLTPAYGETDVLAPAMGETAMLAPAEEIAVSAGQAVQTFTVEYEITFIHTNEVIM